VRTDELRTRFLATDIAVLGRHGKVTERDDYIVVEHVGSPHHYWGNMVIFPHPPAAGDRARWEAIFTAELPAECYHRTFAWDTPVPPGEDPPVGAMEEFIAAGYETEDVVSLVAGAGDIVRPPKFAADVEVVRMDPADDAGWSELVELQVLSRDEGHSEESYRSYARDQARNRREMIAEGAGAWLAARVDDRYVADLGVFVFEGGLGRYQSVGTHPDYRRRGLCGRLVHDAGVLAFEQFGARELVMVADAEYHAARIYESCGFTPVERAIGICEWRRGERAW
jgi:ribosomal protein S18 acetylase RimI-like enzyme